MLPSDAVAVPMFERDPGSVDGMGPNAAVPDAPPKTQAEKGDESGDGDDCQLDVVLADERSRVGEQQSHQRPVANHLSNSTGLPRAACSVSGVDVRSVMVALLDPRGSAMSLTAVSGHSVFPAGCATRGSRYADTRTMDAMLGAYGWDDHWSALFAPFSDGDTQPGRIVRHDRAAPLVATSSGLAHVPVRRNVGALAVGDWVVVEGGEVITDRLERSSLLRRRNPGADEQLLAANIDVVAMVFGADRPLKAGRLFRTRTQIWDAGAVPLVVLTKIDLVEDDGGVDALIGRVHEIDPLLDVVTVSCVTGAGLDDLRRHVAGRTLALVGESGAGKSTLVNALVGGDVAVVSAVRAADNRGRHTTTSRELHPLPDGGVLVDTPGVREVGLWTDESSVDSVFPEIEEHATSCHFRDCTHGSEPGCAVRAAVADGQVSLERFTAWESLRQEAAAATLRADEHSRRTAERGFGRAVKNYKRFK